MTSRAARTIRIAVAVWVAAALGAGIVLVTSDVCTQYGLAGASGLLFGPVYAALGLFVALLIAASLATAGGTLALITAAALSLLLAAIVLSGRVALRSGTWLATGFFFAALAALSAFSAFAFCVSLSA